MSVIIYLAGPDVFMHESLLRKKIELATNKNLTVLSPADILPGEHDSKIKIAESIWRKNLDLIDRCDVVVANLCNFRGAEIDSGTAYEVGCAFALGKKIIGYCESQLSYREKVVASGFAAENSSVDKSGFKIEDFGLTHNLMIAFSIELASSFEDALEKALLVRKL